MATDERWYFTKEAIENSPSRKCGVDAEKELHYRQQGAKLIQDMGQRLQVAQLVINTAIVYMHRFYMFHTFTRFHRNSIGPAAVFLAAKVEEQPRKLEHVIKVAHYILYHHEQNNFDVQSEVYLEKAQDLVMHENVLLQTLGFDVAIDHPHTHVVKCFQLVRNTCHRTAYEKQLEPEDNSKATTDLAQTSYFMATNSLHMTTMCLQYRPAVVACVCIQIVCQWSNYEIQRFTEGRDWFFHVDPSVNKHLLKNLTEEFLAVLDKYPNRLKKIAQGRSELSEERARQGAIPCPLPVAGNRVGSSSMHKHDPLGRSGSSSKVSGASLKTVLSHKEYSEKREKERRERELKMTHHVVAPPIQSRSQPSENSLRKFHSDLSSRSQSSRPSLPPPPKPDHIGHRREISSVCGDERTSENSFDKLPSDKLKQSVNDNRQFHNSDWPQSSMSLDNVNNKVSKVENKKEHREFNKLIPVDVKSLPKTDEFILPNKFDSKFKQEVREESKVKLDVKQELKVKLDLKQELKVKLEVKQEPKIKLEQKPKEVKPELKESSFSLPSFFKDFKNLVHPSDMPPEDIFDNEGDLSQISLDSSFMPSPTVHHKLGGDSPVKPISTSPIPHVPKISIPIDHPDSRAVVKQVIIDKVSNGNSLQLPPKSSSRKKEKIRSPRSSSKSRLHNSIAQPSQSDYQKLVPKEVFITKDLHQTKSSAPISITIPSSTEKSLPQQQQRCSFASPTKLNQEVVVNLNQTLKVHIDRTENCEAALSQVIKKHRHEYSGSHKHKEKKKKNKIKKHKDREHKEHKKHKKKSKNKEKEKEKPPKDDAMPLKFKLVREKGIYTPESGSTVSRLTETSAAAAAPSRSALDTPGRIKLTITKARLQPKDSPPHALPEKPKPLSRKRECSSPPDPQPSKYARPPHEVLDSSARWSSQRH